MTAMPTAPAFNTLQFAAAASALTQASSRLGLVGPGFRCPPRLAGVDRSLRRRADGSAIVAVRVRNRPVAAVLADMIDGVLASNRVTGSTATTLRRALWDAVAGIGAAVEPHGPADVLYRSPAARVA
jgi:hypothetical protein